MKQQVIVCVDDEKVILNSLRRILDNKFGEYRLELAEEAEEALELCEELLEKGHELVLVIADYIMPGMKGDELLECVHALSPKTLTIMLTGQANLEGVTNAVNRAGLYRYIEKPWESTDLCLTIQEALRRYAQEQQLDQQHEALQRMNDELTALNRQLEEYSWSLEQKVAERTEELEQANQELQRLVALDGLTLIMNRSAFDEHLMQEWRRSLREHLKLTFILGDIDHFAAYNQEYGYQAGDACLKQVARALEQVARRSTDLVARYGGEQFAVILPGTNAEGAMHVVENLQTAVHALQIEHRVSSVSSVVTLSLGIVSKSAGRSVSFDDFLAVAEEALQEAKHNGRNQAVLRQV